MLGHTVQTLIRLLFRNSQIRVCTVCKVIYRWMTCDFMSFSTVFQSYQDDGQMIMKGCVQWNPVYG